MLFFIIFVTHIFYVGLFNIADSVLVSLDILLEWREHFKLGCPISNAIAAKPEFLNKLDCVSCIVAKTCAICLRMREIAENKMAARNTKEHCIFMLYCCIIIFLDVQRCPK